MDAATVLWCGLHMEQWSKLVDALQGGGPRGRTGASGSFFDRLEPGHRRGYYRAMRAYAEQDYASLAERVDWSRHSRVLDAGGGSGAVLRMLLAAHPHLEGTLLDLREVVELADGLPALGVDLFSPWPCEADAIVLARVLHDWPDDQAEALLQRALEALEAGGRIYVAEMVLPAGRADGGLLDLNMLVTTGGRERTQSDWDRLWDRVGLRRVDLETLLPWVTVQVLEAR